MGNRVLCGGSLAIVNALKGQIMSLRNYLGMKPKWNHYCTECKYIGTVFNNKDTTDWYTCGQGGVGKTILARFDDVDPSNYWSMPVDVLEQIHTVSNDGTEGYSAMMLLAEIMLKKSEGVHTV